MIFENIPLSAIDFEDEAFRISEELAGKRMNASLRAVGLLYPVILLQGAAPSRFTIVCGFRRLHGLRHIATDAAAAKILTPADGNTLELFLKALWDNLSHRSLTALETARTLFMLKTSCQVEEDILVKHFLPLLGLASHRNVLHNYLHLHGMHPELRRLLAVGSLTLASAERLARVEPGIQAQVSSLFGSVRLSASLQRQVLDLAEDLAAINHGALTSVLNQPEIMSLAEDDRLTAFQKGERIHEFLYRQRNPRLTRARAKFQLERAELELPGNIRIIPDPFFENPRLRVEFEVTTAGAFREAVTALEHSCAKPSLKRIFEAV